MLNPNITNHRYKQTIYELNSGYWYFAVRSGTSKGVPNGDIDLKKKKMNNFLIITFYIQLILIFFLMFKLAVLYEQYILINYSKINAYTSYVLVKILI